MRHHTEGRADPWAREPSLISPQAICARELYAANMSGSSGTGPASCIERAARGHAVGRGAVGGGGGAAPTAPPATLAPWRRGRGHRGVSGRVGGGACRDGVRVGVGVRVSSEGAGAGELSRLCEDDFLGTLHRFRVLAVAPR